MRNARAGTAAASDGGPVNPPDEHDALSQVGNGVGVRIGIRSWLDGRG
jgi:hypothetical protein